MIEFKSGDDVYYIHDGERRDGRVCTFTEVVKITTGQTYRGRPDAGDLYVVWSERSPAPCFVSLKLCLRDCELNGTPLQKHIPPCHRCGLPLASVIRLVNGKHVCDLGDIAYQCEKYYTALRNICNSATEEYEHSTPTNPMLKVPVDDIDDAREAIGLRKLP